MRVQTQQIFRISTAAVLAAAGLLIALLAPGRAFAARTSTTERVSRSNTPLAASVTQPVDIMTTDEGTTQLPASGNTELPATPDTPRPHHDRPPAHLP
ncbi:hypothetical protein AWB64_02065 [Caballeronia sordidicola]|uniref:Secreted protein n=1 Tax=Caballeronia sordidicola TaxID=196367 RepID=A0A158G1L9_CABSO|nr:hypothetical protein [Caballeronia sordidicola]SAL25529.1 hypothetical protein AWB64_02065 [Caballeronia sordidicola]